MGGAERKASGADDVSSNLAVAHRKQFAERGSTSYRHDLSVRVVRGASGGGHSTAVDRIRAEQNRVAHLGCDASSVATRAAVRSLGAARQVNASTKLVREAPPGAAFVRWRVRALESFDRASIGPNDET